MVVNALVAFPRARLDEDERVAKAAHDDGMSGVPPWTEQRWELNNEDSIIAVPDGVVVAVGQHGGLYAVGEHITWWDPTRVLAEVAAKRWILHTLVPEVEDMDETIHQEFCGAVVPDAHNYIAQMLLRQMARIYADHEDYDPDWAPNAVPIR